MSQAVDKEVVGVSYSEAPPPSEGHISSKRVIREDCDESLPPGEGCMSPYHLVRVA